MLFNTLCIKCLNSECWPSEIYSCCCFVSFAEIYNLDDCSHSGRCLARYCLRLKLYRRLSTLNRVLQKHWTWLNLKCWMQRVIARLSYLYISSSWIIVWHKKVVEHCLIYFILYVSVVISLYDVKAKKK